MSLFLGRWNTNIKTELTLVNDEYCLQPCTGDAGYACGAIGYTLLYHQGPVGVPNRDLEYQGW